MFSSTRGAEIRRSNRRSLAARVAAFAALDNVVLYPHHASGTEETRDRMAQLVIDNLAAFFAGKPLLTPVN